jgi:hypothetical protein
MADRRCGEVRTLLHTDADEVSGDGLRRDHANHANHGVVEHVNILARDPVKN